jgi:hypothetical protein
VGGGALLKTTKIREIILLTSPHRGKPPDPLRKKKHFFYLS